MQLSIGTKGEVVIPKKIREQLGLARQRTVFADVKGKSLIITPVREDIADVWERRAKQLKIDASKWKLGDELYEEIFRVPRR